MNTVMSSKGQIVLPKELREQDRIVSGQRFRVERIGAGEYLLKKTSGGANEGLVDLLLSCPVKGWFQPLPSESTDSL